MNTTYTFKITPTSDGLLVVKFFCNGKPSHRWTRDESREVVERLARKAVAVYEGREESGDAVAPDHQ